MLSSIPVEQSDDACCVIAQKVTGKEYVVENRHLATLEWRLPLGLPCVARGSGKAAAMVSCSTDPVPKGPNVLG
jgi:hypothetical protein